MAILMYGYGANSMKYPVTAFTDMETARGVIESLDVPLAVDGDTAVVVDDDGEQTYSRSRSKEVADVLFDGHYFMGSPPARYGLLETDDDVGLFYMSDD